MRLANDVVLVRDRVDAVRSVLERDGLSGAQGPQRAAELGHGSAQFTDVSSHERAQVQSLERLIRSLASRLVHAFHGRQLFKVRGSAADTVSGMERDQFAERYGPWAIVTGASSGLGEGFAHALAARGVRSVLVARRADELERVALDIEHDHGLESLVVPLDLADRRFIGELVTAVVGKEIALVVGNAGYNPAGTFGERDRADLERVLDVNARANLLLADAFLPRLTERRRGGLILVASVEGYFGVPYSTTYAASKAFVLSLAEGLWGEVRRSGVDVLGLVPGPIDTSLFRSRGVKAPAISPRVAAERALDHLGAGPSYVPAALDRWTFRVFRALPRPTAVRLMGFGLRRTLERMRRRGTIG